MTYESFPLDSFAKGLNLRDKPDAVDPEECIDAMNVVFSDRGAIEQRFGYHQFTPVALPGTALNMEPFYTTTGLHQILVGGDSWVQALNNAGGGVANEVGLTPGPFFDFARFGKPNEEVAYAGNGRVPLLKWNSAAWTKPTAKVNGEAGKEMPRAGAICADPNNNRLVCAGFGTTTGGPGGAVSSPSHVYFSEPGEPENYEKTSVVQLTPGDGERIQAVVAWREFVFIFKETKFFVFGGNETDKDGNPIFIWRPVDTGIGLSAPRGVCVHTTGVYFVNHQGVYRTGGQEPELVSSMIEPIFHTEESASPFYLGGVLDHTFCDDIVLSAHEDRVYVGFGSKEANDRALVYDVQFEWWSITDLPVRTLTTFEATASAPELFFGSGKQIFKYAANFTEDNEAAIESRWRSGWFDEDSPDVKTIRSSKVWGSGKCFCGLGYDFRLETGQLVQLDFSAGDVDQWDETTWGGGQWAEPRGLLADYRRVAVRGAVFSLFFSNNLKGQTWSVHRVSHHLREIKRPSVVRA